MGKLEGLLRSLRELYAEIASHLLKGRLQKQAGAREARAHLPIADLLAEQITRQTAKSLEQGQQKAAVFDAASVAASAQGEMPDRLKGRAATDSNPGLFSVLSRRFARHRSQARLDPFMAEKMRTNTIDHLNRALMLARSGQTEGSRIHAELAESAMKTASDYMSDEEFRQLRREAEARLRTARE
jgi:hypothetical protein